MGIGHLFFALVTLAGIVRIGSAIQRGQSASATITATAVFTWLFCLLLPAHLQATDQVTSKLDKADLLAAPSPGELDGLAAFWALELLVIIVAELLVSRIRWKGFRDAPGLSSAEVPRLDQRRAIPHELADFRWRYAKQVAVALILIGVIAYVVFPPPTLDARAEEGQGIGTVLRGALVCGLALVAYFRCFRSKTLLVVLLGGVAYLALLNVRSPLVVVFFALLASEVNLGTLKSCKRVALIVATSVLLALLGSIMSDLRGAQTQRVGGTTSEIIAQTLEDPLVAPFRAGVDTLDGYRLSFYVLPREGAHPEALLSVVTNFVPRAIWPDKPGSLSVDLSSRYLNYRASGQFLSPTGFLSLVTGSYLGGLVGLFVFAFLGAAAARMASGSPWLVFVLVVVFRFFLGGSSFDIYYGFTLAAPIFVVRAIINFHDRLGDSIAPGPIRHVPLENRRQTALGER